MPESRPLFSFESPGLFVVRYNESDDLLPDRQEDLVKEIRRRAQAADVNVMFLVGPKVGMVDKSVPPFWLSVTGEKTLRVRTFAIVSSNAAVRIAALGFSVTNSLRGVHLKTQAFKTEEEGRKWLSSLSSLGA